MGILTGGVGLAVGAGIAAGATASAVGKGVQAIDQQNKPEQVNNNSNSILNIHATNVNGSSPYITIEQAIESELAFYFKEIYRNGSFWNFDYKIRWDSRYWFNFWSIQNIGKTINVDGIAPEEVILFNDIFDKGIRMWHVRDLTLVNINNYEKENLEMSVHET